MPSLFVRSSCLPLMLCLQTAFAQERQMQFDIPPQSLNSALKALAEQGGLKTFYPDAAIAGKSTEGLRGRYGAHDAVDKLLAGTGLTATFLADNAVTVKAGHAVNSANSRTAVLPTVRVSGKTEYDLTDPYNPDYSRPNTSTATKTDTPIMQTPVNIQVVPQQVMKDQQGYQLDKSLQNVSGVFDASNTGANVFMIRGFRSTDYYRDGARIVSGTSIGGQRETANLERIEVLKGPASILYGRAEPGGIINLVPKQPLAIPYYALQQQFASFDFYRTTIDATGPVTQGDSLLYRMNLAYENAGSFREFVNNERIFLAPVLRWNISDKTQANFFLEYKHSTDPMDTGAVALGNRPAPIPRERNLNEARAQSISDDIIVGFDWSHAFNDNWTLRNRFQTEQNNADITVIMGVDLNPTTGELQRYASPQSAKTETYYSALDLTGKFATFGLEHTLLMGADYSNFAQNALYRAADSYPSINIYNPVHTNEQPVVNPANDFPYANTEEWYGLFLQDQLRLPYNVHLLAGMRYDDANQVNDLTGGLDSDKNKVSPRVGLLWQPLPQLSVYGNYVQNFGGVNNATLLRGSMIPPQSAQQWEVGVKTELFDGRFTSTLAYYDLTKQNIPTKDPLHPPFYIATGEARNRGVEWDVSGELLPGWRVIGAYSYIDSEITKDTEDAFGNPIGNQGHRLYNVPRHSGSLWSTYELQQGVLQGLKFGAGVVARGQREGDNANSFQLPGYATVNLMTSYGWKLGKSKLHLQLNIDNLLDKQYYPGSDGYFSFINVGAPRTFLGSLRIEY